MAAVRQEAIDQMVGAFDSVFFKALSEPVRVAIIRHLVAEGPSDIGGIAQGMPQDRSVISRHLKVLSDAGLVRAEKQGRHRIYTLCSGVFIDRLEEILTLTRRCIAACCPEELR